MIGILSAVLLAMVPAPTSAPVELSIAGPSGPITGTLLDPGGVGPAIVIIPGSGPTDRDGNNPLGITAASYRLLAEALAERGIATLRADKRGLFGSKTALLDPNAVTIADYAADAHAWAKLIATRAKRPCVWLLGHSEGGLVALKAAQDPSGLCGVILVSAPGRPLADVMREQLKANPANAPILAPALAALDSLQAGKRVDPASLPAPLGRLFPAQVQGFMIDMFAYDPAKLAGSVTLPMLIVQGTRDLQVGVGDAKELAAAAPKATLALIPDVNHLLKTVASDDRAANFATYGDPSLPVSPALVTTIVKFVGVKR